MTVTWALLKFDLVVTPLVAGLGIAHFFIDRIKSQTDSIQPVRLFIFDQVAHLACLISATGLVVLVYNAHPALVIPATLLYPALVSALCLATMVLYWVWANSLQDEIVERFNHLRWCRRWLLTIEQYAGMVLIGFMSIGAYLSY